MKKVKEDPSTIAKKNKKSNFHVSEKVEYQITGKYEIENQIDKKEKSSKIWKEFKLKTPIPIKKDEYFGLGSKDYSDTSFNYYYEGDENEEDIPNEEEMNSYFNVYLKSFLLNDIVEMTGDGAQVCFYYTLKLQYSNWSEQTHQNYPLSFQKNVPYLMFYFRRVLKVPRVLIYHIFKFL